VNGSGPSLAPVFQLDAGSSITSNPSEVVDGAYSIKGVYTGTAPFTLILETVPALLPLTPNHSYKVTFRYKILNALSQSVQAQIYSPTGGAANSYLPTFIIAGQAGDTGTATLTDMLGPYTDYEVFWNFFGTGAIAIDDIQITDVTTGAVAATANAEPASVPSLVIHP
jgi:hypothetical protein